MVTSQARVVTDRPARYAKQLVSHMSRRIETAWDPDTGTGSLTFPFGNGRLRADEGALHLTVDGGAEDVERLEEVVGKHLVRFGTRDELVVEWQRESGETGTVWRNDEDTDSGGGAGPR